MKRKLEQQLLDWKERSDHRPLLLRGARQVGKTYLVEAFGRDHFDDYLVVDFERRPDVKRCFQTREPNEILRQLEVLYQRPITPGRTLLFLDEIQECPEALLSLRYFWELLPQLHVIAAGSLMEFLLNDHRYSFPVGRVEFAYLRPLSFQEYLDAAAPFLARRLESFSLESPPLPAEHIELLKWVRRYLFVGGMPAAVAAELARDSLLEAQRIHHLILQAYQNDFGKYASQTRHHYLQLAYQKIPALVGQQLKYSRLDSETRSRDLKQALEMLAQAGLIHIAYATIAAGLPLHAHVREKRLKVFFLDIGLLQTACYVNAQEFWDNDILQINTGMMAEQFVGQELLALDDPHQNRPLLFWQKEGSSHAEVDFVIAAGSTIVSIEVKAGTTGRLQSLRQFLNSHKASPLGVRISEHPLSIRDDVLSIPFYLTSRILDLVPDIPHSKPSAETKKAMKDIKENQDLTRYKDVDDFWVDMGLDPNA